MTSAPPPFGETRPRLSWAGFREGCLRVVPFLPGVIAFAAAFGASAVAKGFTLTEAVAMSALVYAGVSQLVGLEMWREAWTPAGLAGLALVTIAINGRMALQGASLHPWLAQHPPAVNYTQLAFLTDANWLIGERYRAQGGSDLGVLVGAGVFLWVIWVAATVPGVIAGRLVADPRLWGLDMVMPVMFAAMGAGLWKGRESIVGWGVAGLAALITWLVVPGYAYIVVGALAGAVAVALRPEPSSEQTP
jgi:predicted branched-subunit amino acid permease